MVRRMLVLCLLAVMALPLAALADWDTGMPAKWVQMPDLTPMGIDVNASRQFILADDFRCTEMGKITGIHIWGSWLNDVMATSARFTLSIHADIPDSLSSTGYSMPGEVLWYRTFLPGQYTVRLWHTGLEGWMDPPDTYRFPADTMCWQYNFPIADSAAFCQQGSSTRPVVYWLDVKAVPGVPSATFGWKTSEMHWNDDAVWGSGSEPYGGPWSELRYPPGHSYYPQSIDLAFVIVSEPSGNLDWGDAPDSPTAPGYPVLSFNGGANHVIGGPWLGPATDAPDAEVDGQPDPNALGDDNNGIDDENGVQIPVLVVGQVSTFTFEISGANGCVDSWFDFNGDQDWNDAGEQINVTGPLAPGLYNTTFTTPASAIVGQTFARFRISSSGGLPPTGAATDGEVEDYEVYIEEAQPPPKWEQLPDLTPLGIDVNDTEGFLLADDFLCTQPGRITFIDVWGSWFNDLIPAGGPDSVIFTLSIHADIPAGPTYSRPGVVLWSRRFGPSDFVSQVWQTGTEGWMDPPDGYIFPADWTCWLYKFRIPPSEAFFQEGTEQNPIVYWLDVQAAPLDPDTRFGWKTSGYHWNDDAVWGQGIEPYPGPWRELRYPPGHEYYGHSIDLAFRLRMDPTSGVPARDAQPEETGLFQNVPNPFTGSTSISYMLPAAGGNVKLEVFDVTGRLVARLVGETQAGGMHSVTWSGHDQTGRDVPTGVYFYRLVTCDRELTQKMTLLK